MGKKSPNPKPPNIKHKPAPPPAPPKRKAVMLDVRNVKNKFLNNEFCLIKHFKEKEKGILFYPEIIKSELDKDDTLIGEYWFDGNGWCFSLFSEYEHLSV